MYLKQSHSGSGQRISILAIATVCLLTALQPAGNCAQGTLERVRQAGKMAIGYRADARPFSYRDESGNVAGYAIGLCQKVADQVKTELSLPQLKVDWVPVTAEAGPRDLQQGKIDLLCGDIDSLTLRKEISFSIPVFAGGIGAMVRADSSRGLQEVLVKGEAAPRPFWRASPAQFLNKKTFSAIAASPGEAWLNGRLDTFRIDAKVAPVESYEAGVRRVLDRSSDVFFADRAILLDAAKRNPASDELLVLDRRFTYAPYALGVSRGDEDLRLLVDQTLSRLYRLPEFDALYAKWFGKPGENGLAYFRLMALPD